MSCCKMLGLNMAKKSCYQVTVEASKEKALARKSYFMNKDATWPYNVVSVMK